MWELDYKESWALNNWCFWTVVLEKTLESPLDCKWIQPVHPGWISPGPSLEGLMLKLKLQNFGHLTRIADSLEKTLMLAKIEGRRRRGWQRMRWMASPTQWTWVWVDSRSWWWTERPGVLRFMGSKRVGHDWATEMNMSSVPGIRCRDQSVYFLWSHRAPEVCQSARKDLPENKTKSIKTPYLPSTSGEQREPRGGRTELSRTTSVTGNSGGDTFFHLLISLRKWTLPGCLKLFWKI